MNRKQRKVKLIKCRKHSGYYTKLRVGNEVTFNKETFETSPPIGFNLDDVGEVVSIVDDVVLVSCDLWDGHDGGDESNKANCWWFSIEELIKVKN